MNQRKDFKIPLFDLSCQFSEPSDALKEGIKKVLTEGPSLSGEEVEEFEKSFARWNGVFRAVGVGSGTDAIHLACRAVAPTREDEIILPSNTPLSTAIGTNLAGGRIVLVDISEDTFLMDNMELIERAITPRTKAIIPIHMYGRLSPIKELKRLCENKRITIIEDASMAHGAELEGIKAGSLGSMGCFSFYPDKNLSTYGDAGCVCSQSLMYYEKLIGLRDCDHLEKGQHPLLGIDSRMDEICAMGLNKKLPKLDRENKLRFEMAQKYNKMLEGVGDLIFPETPAFGQHVFYRYALRSSRREEIVHYLNGYSIEAKAPQEEPIYFYESFRYLNYSKGDFPIAEKLSKDIFFLPLFPGLLEKEISFIADKTRDFFKR